MVLVSVSEPKLYKNNPLQLDIANKVVVDGLHGFEMSDADFLSRPRHSVLLILSSFLLKSVTAIIHRQLTELQIQPYELT